MNRTNIILVGFMGTGKSAVGRILADRLGWGFADADEELERAEATRIADIFRERGEAYFRSRETEILRMLLSRSQTVVSTGGGAVLAEENRTLMLGGGQVIALTARAETIIARVSGSPDRPLLQGSLDERVRTLLKDREHAYDFAHLAVVTDHLTPEQVADRILGEISFPS